MSDLDIWADMSSVMGGTTKNAPIVSSDILDVSERAGQLYLPGSHTGSERGARKLIVVSSFIL